MRVANKRTNMLDGEAIYASGRAIERQSTSNKSKIVIKNTLFFESSEAKLAQQINVYLGLLDVLFKRATERQCEVVYYRLLGKSENEIAEQLKINQSVVNQHLSFVQHIRDIKPEAIHAHSYPFFCTFKKMLFQFFICGVEFWDFKKFKPA